MKTSDSRFVVRSFCIVPLLIALTVGLAVRAGASSLPEIKLTISQTGIYRVTDAELAPALGISSSTVDSLIATGGFTLLNQGHPVSWLPGNNNAEILFHAQTFQNVYTEYNVYWLVAGTNQALSGVNGANPAPVALSSEYYIATTNIGQAFATNCEYTLATNPDSNYWYGPTVFGAFPFPPFDQFGSSFTLPALAAASATAQVNVGLCGDSAATQEMTVKVNGNAAGKGSCG